MSIDFKDKLYGIHIPKLVLSLPLFERWGFAVHKGLYHLLDCGSLAEMASQHLLAGGFASKISYSRRDSIRSAWN
jgi:hypothetical protein